MARTPKHEQQQADKYGKGTAVIIAAAGMVIALLDQVIAPKVTIDFRLYILMAGVALGFYPKIVSNVLDTLKGKK